MELTKTTYTDRHVSFIASNGSHIRLFVPLTLGGRQSPQVQHIDNGGYVLATRDLAKMSLAQRRKMAERYRAEGVNVND